MACRRELFYSASAGFDEEFFAHKGGDRLKSWRAQLVGYG